MTTSLQDSRGWKGRLEHWIGARWRWLVVGVLALFVFNNVLGLFAGFLGLIVFINRIVGRLLVAARVAKKVQQIVPRSDDRGDEP